MVLLFLVCVKIVRLVIEFVVFGKVLNRFFVFFRCLRFCSVIVLIDIVFLWFG